MELKIKIPEIPEIWKKRLSRLMQIIIGLVVVYGIYNLNISIILNAVLSLAISFLPAVLEKDYKVPADPGITFWITLAVLMHAVGFLGPYQNLWWWDVVLHAFGSFLVGAVGYSVVKAIEEHSDTIKLPKKLLSLFVILFVLAIGVLWEILEYLATVSALSIGVDPLATPNPLFDTLLDLVLDLIGGLIFAFWGFIYFTGYANRLKEKLDQWHGKVVEIME
ncbi:MAG: hypothetical protein SVV03_03320 [Candidatus Nanohaloarchaea archaeon]|nr:hypothetical protein [Candidatus Nanohaloarchaea archaeon]